MEYFVITVRFPQETFHGRGADGQPEWPPSPLRLFSALVASAGRREGTEFAPQTEAALQWLAVRGAPEIVAAAHVCGRPYETAVPNNALDLVAKRWSKGSYDSDDAQPATHRTMKRVQTAYLADDAAVHFAWTLDEPLPDDHFEILRELARSVVAVGWGLDLAIGNAERLGAAEWSGISGERWTASTGGAPRRVPTERTLHALRERHRLLLARLDGEDLAAVPPLPPHALRVVGYSRPGDSTAAAYVAFALRDPQDERFYFCQNRRGCVVAGMTRHAVREAAEASGWDADRIAKFVMGHAEARGAVHEPVSDGRLAYVPLPSIEPRGSDGLHVGGVRRVLLFAPGGLTAADATWLKQRLSGAALVNEQSGKRVAELSEVRLSRRGRLTDKVLPRYVTTAATWATVTPVVLPGRDDHRMKKAERLVRKSIRQAGFPEELAAHAEIACRRPAFLPGADSAEQWFVPKHLRNYSRLHVRITWRDASGAPLPIAGPIVLGAGRFYGLGLFAADESKTADSS